MSQYFQVGNQVLWNPSNAVAGLFVRTAEALSPLVDRPSGLATTISDEYHIDMPAFEAFVNALVQRYRSTTHPVMRALLEGFIATALVLVERAGGAVPALDAPAGMDHRDVSVGDAGVGAQAGPGRLTELAAHHASGMPC